MDNDTIYLVVGSDWDNEDHINIAWYQDRSEADKRVALEQSKRQGIDYRVEVVKRG